MVHSFICSLELCRFIAVTLSIPMSSPRTSSDYSRSASLSGRVPSSQHPLNITVMRLNKPTLHINRPLASSLLRNMHTIDSAHAVTNLLSLPDAPGDTYLGQVFLRMFALQMFTTNR